MNNPVSAPPAAGRSRDQAEPAARTQLKHIANELTQDQADRALTVLEASSEWIVTGTMTPKS